MSIPLNINGQTFQYPEVNDVSWGPDATDWAVAVTSGMLQKSGGLFILLADVDFGATYGLVSQYFKSRTTNAATAGSLRLAVTDSVSFRNNANSANLSLGVNGSDQLTFNGSAIGNFVSVSDTSTIDLTLSAGVLTADIVALSITNAVISASAAIAYSKLALSNSIVNADISSSAAIGFTKLAALTASRALQTSAGGVIEASSVTSTELGYVSGVTSAIQTQLNAKQASDAELTAIAALASDGLIAKTGAGTAAVRTVTGTANEITVTNGSGVSGNPTLAIATDPVLPGTGAVTLPDGTTAQRPGSPVEGMIRYNTDTDSFEGYAGSAWGEIGGSSGGINYITNGNAEVDTAGWATYANAAAAIPVNGTGGSPSVTITRSTSSPLRPLAQFVLTKPALNDQGEGVSYAFTIDKADLAQVLTIGFDYKASAGFAFNGASYASPSDVAVYIFDVTNSVIIYPSQSFLDGSGKFISQFQTDATSTSYRLIFHVATTNASAWTFDFDNVTVGPSQIATGAVMSDWASYTPTYTGFGTPSSSNILWRRSGDSLQIRGVFVTGTNTGVEARMSLPPGLTTPSNIGTLNSLGFIGSSETASTTWFGQCALIEPSVSYITFGTRRSTTTDLTKVTGSSLCGNGSTISLPTLTIPIAGWSSNLVVSSDYGNRVIAVEASGTPTGSLSAASATIWGTENRDTTASYNPATGEFTAPETGDYEFNAAVLISGTEALDSFYSLQPYVNGVARTRFGGFTRAPGTLTNQQVQANGCTFLNAGEVLTFRTNTNVGSAAFAAAALGENYLSVRKVQSPQTLAGGEVVAFRGTNAAGTSLSTSTTLIPLVAEIDTHGTYNSGTSTWVCPVSGLYNINAQVIAATATVAAGVFFRCFVTLNGTGICQGRQYGTGASDNLTANSSTMIRLVAGDSLTIAGGPETGTLNLDGVSTNNFLTISKVN
jgi:hypothetical protein